jgi:hypothetical protein
MRSARSATNTRPCLPITPDRAEIDARLSVLDAQRRHLTGEPEPEVATAAETRARMASAERPTREPQTGEIVPQRGAQEPAGAESGAEQGSAYSAAREGVSTLYHGTSPETALRFALGAEDKAGLHVTPDESLALGQGGKGAVVEFTNTHRIDVERASKPGSEMVARQTGQWPEYIVAKMPHEGRDVVRAVTLDAGVEAPPVLVRRARSLGWTAEQLPDGRVRYSNPALTELPVARANPYADLFGEKAAEKIEQGGLFGEQAGTEGSRPLANAERAARSELDQLRTKYEATTDPAARQEIAARMSELEKLTNWGEKIGGEELGRRAVAAGGEPAKPHDPYGDLTAERPAPFEPETIERPTRDAGVVLEDGEKRFASARSAGGTKRNPDRVSTPGLLDELLDMEQRRANAEQGSIYEVRDDPNFHTSGIPQIVSTKTPGGGPSRQAKALTNLDAFKRAQAEIEAALAKRGLSGDALTEALRDHHETREERRAISGDFDPGNARRDQVHDAAGKPLFSQTPDAFDKGEAPTRHAGVEIERARAEEQPSQPAGKLGPPSAVQRTVDNVSVRLAAYKDAAQRVFAPASRGEDAGRIALAIREHEGDFARRNEQAREAFKDFAKLFDRMEDADRLDFIDRIETGRDQPTPALQAAATLMRRLLDEGRDAIRALGTGKLEHWIENYFPHLWENEADARSFVDRVMSKRSLSGPGTFLKPRTIPTLREGIEAGLEPLTTNPVDMTLLKLREMNKYLTGQRILAEMKQMGFAKFVHAMAHAPDGLVKLDDKLGTVYGPPHVEVTEAFDKLVRDKLEGVMRELGVQHTRKPSIGGRGRLGYAEGSSRITTKNATPDTVIEHELGHILDAKLNVWQRLTDIPGQSKEAIASRKQLHGELRALADMRYEGMDPDKVPGAFKEYVRKRQEKVANAVHALVYMPDRMQEVAPMVKERLTSILQSHPVAAKLLDVQPSLTLGTADFKVPTDGLVIRGHWYVPEPVATVVNNYLSPGLRGNPFFDLYRGVGNTMNQAQLGLSAFHLGFTSMDAMVSKTALSIEQLAAGRPVAALGSLAEMPVAAFTNYLRGSKLLTEYLKPGTEGGEMADIVNALVKGGGRVRMDEFYGGGAVKQFREALTRGKYGKASRLSLGAIMEASSHLVMSHIVPRQKLGVFADLARFELSRLPENATKDEVRAAFSRAWDSVDNRMGQVVYDNLFWHRVAKDLTMASVRSVGWNLGTIRELGGGLIDAAKMPKQLLRGGGTQLSHRAAYVAALPFTVGLAGAILNYLNTGEAPRSLKDYFYPRTGRKNPDGTDERVQLPSYIRDVGDYARHPVQTLVNKAHPLAGTIREMLQNEDYYGHEIHNGDDPLVQQLGQEAHYIAGQFEPFGIRNGMEQWKRGQKKAALGNAFGVTPAPREETRTAADLRMSQELGRRARGQLTPEEVERQQQRRGALDALRSHDPNAASQLREAIGTGAVKPNGIAPLMHDAMLQPDVLRFKSLPLEEAMRVYGMATPQERQRYGPALMQKLDRARKQGTMPVIPPGLLAPHRP